MIPELPCPPPPSDVGYPIMAASGYPSPVESDTVQTPCVEHDHPASVYCEVLPPGMTQILYQQGTNQYTSDNHQHHKGSHTLVISPIVNDSDLPRYSTLFPPDGLSVLEDVLVQSFSDVFTINVGCSQGSPSVLSALPPCPPKVLDDVQPEQCHPDPCNNATFYSWNFPVNHKLDSRFLCAYALSGELGTGGYGFVMTGYHRTDGYEVAIKFIIKNRVPDHAWMENDALGRLPTEVVLLSLLDHENIVKCLDLFEDSLYFYLVQELHGSPWHKSQRNSPKLTITSWSSLSPHCPTPTLSPSGSSSSLDSLERSSSPPSPSSPGWYPATPQKFAHEKDSRVRVTTLPTNPATLIVPRPQFSRRASHDLFECIEQSEHKRLPEEQARYVFSQVVDTVHYLDSQGITHRDIKDENLVIDKSLKVKLIDFGSAVVVDPNEPTRPFYDEFYGTAAYAAPEILLHQHYQAAPAEIWTLGVLLSYLLTGASPFRTTADAIHGNLVICGAKPSRMAIHLMSLCLDPNPQTRATITDVKAHRWLAGTHVRS